MPGTRGRNLLVAIGTARYQSADFDPLPGVPDEVRSIVEIFHGMGYDRVSLGAGENPGRAGLLAALRGWFADFEFQPEDVVVVYISCHGQVGSLNRHYLVCADTRMDDLAGTAIETAALAELIAGGRARNVLVILDLCYAQAGAFELAEIARRAALGAHRANLAVITAAGEVDPAQQGAFVDALKWALERDPAGDWHVHRDLGQIVGYMNRRLQSAGHDQRAALVLPDSAGGTPFFVNPRFDRFRTGRVSDPGTLYRIEEDYRLHFDHRARGIAASADGDLNDYFTGREAVLRELSAWLREPGDDVRIRVVTGHPGSGKSAVLGRLVSLASPAGLTRGDVLVGEESLAGRVDLSMHARALTMEGIVVRVADAVGAAVDTVDALVGELEKRLAGTRLTIILDGLDEAGGRGDLDEARRIAGALLKKLGTTTGIHLVVGTRRELLPYLDGAHVLDLDTAAYTGSRDVAGYAERVLLGRTDSTGSSPFRGRPEQAAVVARGVAARAGGSFLVAGMISWAVARGELVVDLADRGWVDRLPSDPGGAFRTYLRRFGSREPGVISVLAALAFAEGPGLPQDEVWPALASALVGDRAEDHAHARARGRGRNNGHGPGNGSVGPEDVDWVLSNAASYVVEVKLGDGRVVHRLFHEALAEYLRGVWPDRHAAQARITRALVGLVPVPAASWHGRPGRDWSAAHPYVLRNLATHAAATVRADPDQPRFAAESHDSPGRSDGAGRPGSIDGLAGEAEFLLHAVPDTLLSALDHARTPAGQVAAAVYGASFARHHRADPWARRELLAIDAARCRLPADVPVGREAFDPVAELAAELARPLRWRPRWATGSLIDRAARRTLTGHAKGIRAVASTGLRPAAGGPRRASAVVGCGDGTVRVWDLRTNRQHFPAGLTGHSRGVFAVACGEAAGRPVAVTGSSDATVRAWFLDDGSPLKVLGDRTGERFVVAFTDADEEAGGLPMVVSGSSRGEVQVWDFPEPVPRPLAEPHRGPVTGLVCLRHEGVPLAVTTSEDGTARLWHVAGVGIPPLVLDLGRPLFAVACVDLGQHPVAVLGMDAGGDRCALVLWDLRTGDTRAVPTGDVTSARVVACTTIGDRQFAVTGAGGVGDDHTVRLWELTPGISTPLRAVLHGHTGTVTALACADVDGPVALSGSSDGDLRVWDLDRAVGFAERAAATGEVTAVAVARQREDAAAAAGTVAAGTAAAGRVVTGTKDGFVRAVDLATGQPLHTFGRHSGQVRALVCVPTPMGVTVVSAGGNGPVLTWDLATGRRGAGLRDYLVDALATASGDGAEAVVVTANAEGIRCWKLSSGTETHRFPGQARQVTALAAVRAGGRLLVASGAADGSVRAWEAEAPDAVRTFHHAQAVTGLAWTTLAGEWPTAVASFQDGAVCLLRFDAGTGAFPDPEFLAAGSGESDESGEATVLACTGTGGRTLVAAGGTGNTVTIWDLDTRSADRVAVPYPVGQLAWGADGELVVGCGRELIVLESRVGGPHDAQDDPSLQGPSTLAAGD